MKSLIFLTALCVVSTNAYFANQAEYEAEVARTKEIIEKCTDGVNVSPDDYKSLALGEPSDLQEQGGQVLYCFMNEAGLMDGATPRTETMCQMAMEHTPNIGESLCNIFHDCADSSQSPDGNNDESTVATRFVGCVTMGVAMSCTKSLEMRPV